MLEMTSVPKDSKSTNTGKMQTYANKEDSNASKLWLLLEVLMWSAGYDIAERDDW